MLREITLIAAVSEDGFIGTGRGGLPWRLPRDAAHFRASVAGKAMVLGRTTYGEMRGWFRDERPIVLTSNPSFRPAEAGTRVAHSFPEVMRRAEADGDGELMVAGGASVYALALPHATRLILSHVATRVDAPDPSAPRFPDIDPARWLLEREEVYPPDAENLHALRVAWSRRAR